MARAKKMVDRIKELMHQPENIRNIGIVAHIDHGKTTLTDNLLAGAGMISKELAGRQLFMDYDEEEQERGITINSANVSMVHEYAGQEYLINLIDTPGHVDFGGDVTRAMRAVDGAVVVVDAVEGAMPQTETVLRQALKENVKPVLFVNKVDRLINELRVDPQTMQIRLGKVIDNVNKLVRGMSEEKYKSGWKMSAADGSVAFGSALYNWAISAASMKNSGIGFKEVIDYCKEDSMKELAEKCPLHEVINDMVVRFLPNPLSAQKKRVPVIWRGELDSEIGKAMVECNPDAPTALMVTDITVDPHAGEIASGRLFSGTLRRGDELYISGTGKKNKVQQVGIYMGPAREEVDTIPSGNIVALSGLKDAVVGATVSTEQMEPFEAIRHASEPVVTVAVEASNMKDLPKLIEVLRQIAKEDPTLNVNINEETGEHLLAGMGELHLEVVAHKIEREKGVPISTSPPIVVYRETVVGKSDTVEGKSPNKHNRFYIAIEPLEPDVLKLIVEGEVDMRMPEVERRQKLIDAGLNKEEAKGITNIYESNIFVDMTKGVQHLRETMELVHQGFEEVMKAGPMSRERVRGVKAKLMDVKLHEDAVHRGPAQVIPAVRNAVHAGILRANATLLEPIQKVVVHVPQDQMSGAVRVVQGRRGIILSMGQEGDMSIIEAKAPVAELFGFAGDLRSGTEGRAMWSTEFAGFEPLPQSLLLQVVRQIRQRKGLKLEIPTSSDFVEV
ncbi:MAG: elongation factor EF-2 [Methermicoccaceae archaeon]